MMEGGEEVMRGGHEESIFVSVRLRPLSEKEILKNDVSDWECINDTTIIYKNNNLYVSDRSMYPTAYTFGKKMNVLVQFSVSCLDCYVFDNFMLYTIFGTLILFSLEFSVAMGRVAPELKLF